MKREEILRKEAHASKLNVALGQPHDKKAFTLLAPAKLTVKRDATYTKQPFIGGESFSISSVYVGKSGSLIYLMKEMEFPGRVIEILARDIEKHFPIAEVTSYIEGLMSSTDDGDMDKAAKEARIREEESAKEALLKARQEDERFGSW